MCKGPHRNSNIPMVRVTVRVGVRVRVMSVVPVGTEPISFEKRLS